MLDSWTLEGIYSSAFHYLAYFNLLLVCISSGNLCPYAPLDAISLILLTLMMIGFKGKRGSGFRRVRRLNQEMKGWKKFKLMKPQARY